MTKRHGLPMIVDMTDKRGKAKKAFIPITESFTPAPKPKYRKRISFR